MDFFKSMLKKIPEDSITNADKLTTAITQGVLTLVVTILVAQLAETKPIARLLAKIGKWI